MIDHVGDASPGFNSDPSRRAQFGSPALRARAVRRPGREFGRSILVVSGVRPLVRPVTEQTV
jgi:hypothetical protein